MVHNIIQYVTTPSVASTNAGGGALLVEIFKSFLAPALIAVFFTGMTSFVLERLKGKREAITNLSIALRDDLEELQNLSGEYWSTSSKSDPLQEARIMCALEGVCIGLLSFHKDRGIKLSSDMDAWIIDLRDTLTGGGFQTKGRLPDFPRLQSVASKLSKMRYRIFEQRLKSL